MMEPWEEAEELAIGSGSGLGLWLWLLVAMLLTALRWDMVDEYKMLDGGSEGNEEGNRKRLGKDTRARHGGHKFAESSRC